MAETICKSCANINICRAGKDSVNGGNVKMLGCSRYKEREVKTNADRIRYMTDEEMARYIVHLVKQGNRQAMADYECGLNWLRDEYDRFFFDYWLKQEATDG